MRMCLCIIVCICACVRTFMNVCMCGCMWQRERERVGGTSQSQISNKKSWDRINCLRKRKLVWMLKVFIPILSEHGDIKNVVEKEKYRLLSIHLSKNKNKKKAQVIDLNKQRNLSRYVNIYSPSSFFLFFFFFFVFFYNYRGRRIHWLHLCRRITATPNDYSEYDIKFHLMDRLQS